MSVSRPDNMRGPRVKTPLLLLLLLLLNILTGTVLCQEEEDGENTEAEPEAEPEAEEEAAITDSEPVDGDAETTELSTTVSDATVSTESHPTDNPVEESIEEEQGSGIVYSVYDVQSPITEDPSTVDVTDTPEMEENVGFIIPAAVGLVVVIIGMIVGGIFISRRWNKKTKNQELRQEDPYLDECSTEKVPMPMFEEDVPSVLELEMEELDQWMKKDGETAEVP